MNQVNQQVNQMKQQVKNINVNLIIYHALSYTSTKPCYVVYRHATETRETNISNKRNKDKNLNWQETSLTEDLN